MNVKLHKLMRRPIKAGERLALSYTALGEPKLKRLPASGFVCQVAADLIDDTVYVDFPHRLIFADAGQIPEHLR